MLSLMLLMMRMRLQGNGSNGAGAANSVVVSGGDVDTAEAAATSRVRW